ncbi:FAD/NAD(P)-binding domain-containing protein [Mycena rebaudengoi]|nr:FAD/NAD(P)-binding domain-containing protein [Mycena rebaudengoi]
MSTTKNIVIVGASAGGGSAVARALSKNKAAASYSITLINPLPYAISRPTLPRMTVSGDNDLLETALIPFDKLFSSPNAKFVQGKVARIQTEKKGGFVVVENGEQLPYDVLVLAPGSLWEGALDMPDNSPKALKESVLNSRETFKKAQKIVLAGGGAVGLEFAGEIKDAWPEKEVTIVHGDNELLNPTYKASFRKALEKGLRARGVKIILNDFIDEFPAAGPAVVKTRNGHHIDADLVLATRGPRPNTAFVVQSLGDSAVDEKNQIRVKRTLQLEQHPNIFAIGDANNIVEQKQVMKALAHSAIVASNIVAYIDNKPLKEYKGSSEMIIITNGKGGGGAYLGVLWGLVFGDWFARMTKSKTLMVSMTRGLMGY